MRSVHCAILVEALALSACSRSGPATKQSPAAVSTTPAALAELPAATSSPPAVQPVRSDVGLTAAPAKSSATLNALPVAPTLREPDATAMYAALLASLATAPPAESTTPPTSDDDAASGARDARVTAIVFGDLECPFTARAVTTLRSLQSAYGASVLRLVWKHRPLDFHRRARAAARAAQSVFVLAGGEAFWRFVDEATREPSALDDSDLAAWSKRAGAPAGPYAWLVGDGRSEVDAKIDADSSVADEYGARGVPVVWVASQRLEGAQPAAAYAAAIDEGLAGTAEP